MGRQGRGLRWAKVSLRRRKGPKTPKGVPCCFKSSLWISEWLQGSCKRFSGSPERFPGVSVGIYELLRRFREFSGVNYTA